MIRPSAFLLLALCACRGPGTMKVTCIEGYTDCNGVCVDLQNDAKHCGACDNACAAGMQCAMGTCQPICPARQHPCNGVCVSDASTATCGKMCTPCPMPPNSLATCDGMTCGLVCDPNFRLCNGTCSSCPSGNGSKCSGSQCVSSGCPKGQHLCNGECVEENGNSCGDTCRACPTPPANSYAACVNGTCEVLCRPGYRSCAGGCCPADFIELGAFHTCRINPNGGVLCWGKNHLDAVSGGAIGDDTLLDRSQPVQVSMLTTGMVATQLGSYHSCAMNQFGAVFCWGVAGSGRLGDGSSSDKLIPTPVTGLIAGSAIAISAGGSGGCALMRSGELRCWGDNTRGEVGDGTKDPRNTPTPVTELGTNVIDVSFGGAHVCAVLRGGSVRCWGDNAMGQLGDGSRDERTRPVVVPGLTSVVRVVAGERHTCAIRSNGELHCWGDNAGMQLGLPANEAFRSSPVHVASVAAVTEVALGGAHTCVLFSAGQVQCWGSNDQGQLGDGTMFSRPMPVAVTGLDDGTSISAGRLHTCARTRSGTRCWGDNEFGQLGDGTSMDRVTPVMTQ